MRPWPGWLKIRIPPWIRRRWPCSRAADEYPQLDVEAYLSEIDGLAHEVRPYLGGSLERRSSACAATSSMKSAFAATRRIITIRETAIRTKSSTGRRGFRSRCR